MQNYGIDIVEALLRANGVRVIKVDGKADREQLKIRQEYQQKAFTDIKVLAYLSQVAMEQHCILVKQYEQITKKLYDCQNLLGAWVKSDNKRYVEEKSS